MGLTCESVDLRKEDPKPSAESLERKDGRRWRKKEPCLLLL
jgi:hypothetical protein